MQNKEQALYSREKGLEYRYFECAGRQTHARTSTCYAFILSMTNASSLVMNGEKQRLQENTLVLLRPGDTCALSCEAGGSPILIGLSVGAESMESLFAYLGDAGTAFREKLLKSSLPPISILSVRQRQSMLLGIQQFNGEKGEAAETLRLALRFFLAEALGLFAKWMRVTAESGVPAWLERTCIQMEKKENFVEGLPRMVAISGKTREHLARSMQKYKHITISEFINTLRLEYAASELAGSDIRIIDLCFESGFTSLDYFGKLFKKKYGMAPTSFRNRSKKEA